MGGSGVQRAYRYRPYWDVAFCDCLRLRLICDYLSNFVVARKVKVWFSTGVPAAKRKIAPAVLPPCLLNAPAAVEVGRHAPVNTSSTPLKAEIKTIKT